MKCSQASAFVDAYVDGELAGMDRDSYEQHLVECDACSHACRLQARFKAAVRGHLPRPHIPQRMRERLSAALAAAPPIRRNWPWHGHPRLTPAVAAIAAVLTLVVMARSQRSPMLAQALRVYHAGVPMDIVDSSCASIANWFRGKLDFALPPTPFAKLGDCQGGRLVNVEDRFGAYLVYQVRSGPRVGVMVWGGDDQTIGGGWRRHVTGQEWSIGREQGASFATFRGRDGLNYVVTTDQDENALTTIVQAAFQAR